MSTKNVFHTVEVIEKTVFYTIEELCRIANLDESWVRQLIDYEVIKTESDTHRYTDGQLRLMLKAYRLQRDLELNIAGVALALQLLEKIEQQENELNLLRRQLSFNDF